MNPYIKFGILKTSKDHGFMDRSPQVVMKLAQDKIIEKEGVRKKVKGVIIEDPPNYENWFKVRAKELLDCWHSIVTYYKSNETNLKELLHQ
jgi:hypothetical protein